MNTGSGNSIGRFFLGLTMLIMGGYLFLQAIHVSHHVPWGMGMGMFNVGEVKITPGLVLVPFIFGIGMIFYNPKNDLGWLLMLATLIMLSIGVISNLQFRMRSMSAFELLMIILLAIGGLGLLLSGARDMMRK